MRKYEVGDIITCTVTGIEDYGFFIKTNDNYDGLVHISEISDEYIRKINYYVKLNETIKAKILEINEESKKLILTIKNVRYKQEENFHEIVETKGGFDSLQRNLDRWMTQTLKEIEAEKVKN